MLPITVIVWTYTVVFSMTALITLGGLIENFPFIKVKDQYMRGLFRALILEIIGGAVVLAANAIATDGVLQLGEGSKYSELKDANSELKEVNKDLTNQLDSTTKQVTNLKEQVKKIQSELDQKSRDIQIPDITVEEVLESDSQADFRKLEELLWQKKWIEADIATDALEPLQLKCSELEIVDSLWIEASDGNFGYSKQREIWEIVKKEPIKKKYEKFAVQVGWNVGNRYKHSVNELDISDNSPKEGQLPFNGWQIVGSRDMQPFMDKLKNCNI